MDGGERTRNPCQGPDGNATVSKGKRRRCGGCGLLLHRDDCEECRGVPHLARCGLVCAYGFWAEEYGRRERADLHRKDACPVCDGLGYRPPECSRLERFAAAAALAGTFGDGTKRRIEWVQECADAIYDEGPAAAAHIVGPLLEAAKQACAARERLDSLAGQLKEIASRIDRASPGYAARRRVALERIARGCTSGIEEFELCSEHGIDPDAAAAELRAMSATFTDELEVK
jgi:hypothetical protein